VIHDAAGLVSLVQFGVLEIHIWGARADDVERPDRLVFDLDPDPSVEWKRVVAAARMLRGRLQDWGLESFVKTTGGKGLHVVLPIRRQDLWGVMKQFSHGFVDLIVADSPDDFTANMSKAARRGKIYIDFQRNERGATWIAPYSTRSRTGAPVSVPLEWEELSARVRGDHFTVKNVPARLQKLKRDPWEGIDKLRQSITAKLKKAVGMS
jgi:bifunctional non-homologous end joining protein LigD